jgi:death-on-curing protein
MTGGEHGYLNNSNLEYLLDTVKDVGERLHRKQALTKKAAFLLYHIITLHPFVNGNKRTAYELVKLFLRLNGYQIDSDPGEAYQFLLDVASGKVSAADVDKWVAMNLTELKEG